MHAFTGVRFAPGVGSYLTEPGFASEAFSVSDHALVHHGAAKAEGFGRVAAGQLDFTDVLGRWTSVLDYTGCRFTEATASTLILTLPVCLMFVVPAPVVAGIPLHAAGNHTAMLEFVAANAVRWDSSVGASPEKYDYVICVFILDRISSSAVVMARLSENETGIGGFKKNSRYMDVGGWRFGISPNVRLCLRNANFFVKAMFTPGQEVGFAARQPRLIELFSINLHKAQATAWLRPRP